MPARSAPSSARICTTRPSGGASVLGDHRQRRRLGQPAAGVGGVLVADVLGLGGGRQGVDVEPEAVADPPGEIGVDVHEAAHHALDHAGHLHLAELERVGVDDVVLLDVGHAVPEQGRLGVRVVRTALADLRSLHDPRHVDVAALLVGGEERAAAADAVGQVRRAALVHGLLREAVAEVVVHRGVGPVDRDLVEVRAAEAGELGVEVAEQAGLHQRVVDDLDAAHQVADVERHLLDLGEEVARAAVEGHPPDRLDRHQLLGDELGGVEQVDALEVLVLGVGHHLHAELPLGEGAGDDGVVEVAAVEVGVDAVERERLLPHQAVHAEHRLPVELHQRRLAGVVDEAEGVDAEALHHPVRARDGPVGHRPHQHVRRLGDQRHEVPEGRVGGLRLRDLAVGLGLGGVDQVGELDAVPDEEHRDVVADEVEVALVCVELHGEAADVAHGVGRAAGSDHGGEPGEHRRASGRPARNPALVIFDGGAVASNTPWAPAPRAWTTRSGMRSWSKCMIFSRRWKSSMSVGPAHAGLERVVGVLEPLAGARW